MDETWDIAVIGAGAAGLMAAIAAGRSGGAGGAGGAGRERGRGLRIIALDGARTIGAKILVAGGGRCNVTHFEVDETAYGCGPGTTRNAIRKVLRSFGVERTVGFFRELGVELKREPTGKLFPTTDDGRTVLSALVRAAADAGVTLRHPWRVGSIERGEGGFVVRAEEGEGVIRARRVVMATGGKALPRTGSDGKGYDLLRALGHSVTGPVFPALVPLVVDPARSFIPGLSGLTHVATLTLRSGTGKKLAAFTNSTLCTHFGLSGPGVLDISRYYLDARRGDPGAALVINWTPGETFESMDGLLAGAAGRSKSVGRVLGELVPERLARALCESAGVDAATPLERLKREERRAAARAVTEMEVPVTGDRGFTHAEVTAGGVPLSELNLATMESRVCAGLHVCGEVCDVDGRIGGFNFQWAWASGDAAGRGAAAGVMAQG